MSNQESQVKSLTEQRDALIDQLVPLKIERDSIARSNQSVLDSKNTSQKELEILKESINNKKAHNEDLSDSIPRQIAILEKEKSILETQIAGYRSTRSLITGVQELLGGVIKQADELESGIKTTSQDLTIIIGKFETALDVFTARSESIVSNLTKKAQKLTDNYEEKLSNLSRKERSLESRERVVAMKEVAFINKETKEK